MKRIRFSVIIPAYNAAACIRAALESCLHQSRPPFEVIVVDDASTDQTAALVQAHFGKWVTLLSTTQNSGPSAARNLGLAQASGDYIAFLDADDVWHPEKLACIEAVLLAQPEIKFLFHPYTTGKLPAALTEKKQRPERYPLWKLLLRNVVATPCAVLQRHESLCFRESMRYMEDYELFLRQAAEAGLWRIPVPLTRLGRPVLSAGGQSSNRLAMRAGEWQAWWHFAQSRPLYFFALPFLILLSILKHVFRHTPTENA